MPPRGFSVPPMIAGRGGARCLLSVDRPGIVGSSFPPILPTCPDEASRILQDLWSRKQVEVHQAEPEARTAIQREIEALSVAITALELLPD